jgi:PAS domain-containing protein
MSLPSGTDYSEAVQNPRSSFEDSELQTGQPELTSIGLPKPRAGNFATVFKMKCRSRNWAVRCFTHEVIDQRDRYEQITAHLKKYSLPYTVGFEFMQRGIWVRGQSYPIVKMEWVDGVSIKNYIDRHLYDQNSLLLLSDRWISMVRSLHQAGIAHGDLQHGNIIIVGDDLKLVDYDGMFVPGLAGRHASELGHRNYQHPKRSERDFGSYLDNFSSWVIYISLRIIAANPSAWKQLQPLNDEALMFRKEDFVDPDISSIFRMMEFSTDPVLQNAQSLLREFIAGEVANVPPLEERLASIPPPEPIDGSWIKTHIKQKQDSPQVLLQSDDIVATSRQFDDTWIETHIPPLPRKQFGSFAYERILVLLTTISAGTIVVAGFYFQTPGYLIIAQLIPFGLVNPVIWYVRYSRNPVRKEYQVTLDRYKPLFINYGQRIDFLKKANKKKVEINAGYDREIKKLELLRLAIDNKEKDDLDLWQRGLQTEINKIIKKRQNLQQEEIRKIEVLFSSSQESRISAQINNLISAENNEIHIVLKNKQNNYIVNYLQQQDLASANLMGISSIMKATLQAYGITNADNVSLLNSQKIPGIGDARRNTLFGWRRMQEINAQNRMPNQLTPLELSRIQANYQSQRSSLEQQRKEEKVRIQNGEQAIRIEFNSKRQQCNQEEQQARSQVNSANESVKKFFREERIKVSEIRRVTDESFRDKLKKVRELEENVRKELQKSLHKRAAADREMNAFKDIRFSRYMMRVFEFWRRAS